MSQDVWVRSLPGNLLEMRSEAETLKKGARQPIFVSASWNNHSSGKWTSSYPPYSVSHISPIQRKLSALRFLHNVADTRAKLLLKLSLYIVTYKFIPLEQTCVIILCEELRSRNMLHDAVSDDNKYRILLCEWRGLPVIGIAGNAREGLNWRGATASMNSHRTPGVNFQAIPLSRGFYIGITNNRLENAF